MKIMKGKKAFLWKTVAALVILALCAVPVLASFPTYADDGGASAPAADASAPAADAPVVDAPVADAPAVDAPAVDASAPAVDAPAADAPVADAPAAADAPAGDTTTEQTASDEAVTEETATTEETTGDEAVTEETATTEETTGDEAVTEETATTDETTGDEAVTEETATTDETTSDEAVTEETATTDETTSDEAVTEETATDETVSGEAVAETGGPTVHSDQADYAPEETPVITGGGFPADTLVTVTVTTPDGTVTTFTTTTDSEGQFTGTYEGPLGRGEYAVTATDGATTAATTFTDANVLVYDNSLNPIGNPAGYGSINAALGVVGGNGWLLDLDASTFNESVIINSALFSWTTVTLMGQGAGSTTVDGNSRVFTIGSGMVVTLTGMTIKDGDSGSADGGGIYNEGTLTLNDSTVTSNETDDTSGTQSGGGIYNTNTGTLTLNNSTVSNNFADDDGGGIYNAGTAILNNSTVTQNDTDDGSGTQSGGGIYNTGTLTLNNSTVSSNYADNYGGGIYNAGTSILNNSTVSKNEAHNDNGGGIYNTNMLTLNNSTVSDNYADNYGGGIYNTGTATINSSTISGNEADSDDGGGIYTASGTLTLKNSTVSGNTADDDGGGIYSGSGTTSLTHVTITENKANDSGGGWYLTSGATTRLYYSIVARNKLGSSYSDSANWNSAPDTNTGNIKSNATNIIESTLDDNGGPTKTHALKAGSPAIDAASGSTEAYDQRGVARPYGDSPDIGAFEWYPPVDTAYVDDDWTSQADVIGYNPSLTWSIDAFNNIQSGVNAVTGSTVYVLPGTYTGDVIINSGLSLLGGFVSPTEGNFLVCGTDTANRGAESVIEDSQFKVADYASNVTIAGFTFDQGKDDACIEVGKGVDGTTIENNIFHRSPGPGADSAISLAGQSSSSKHVTDTDIRRNYIEGFQYGIDMDYADFTVITSNYFTGNTYAIDSTDCGYYVDGYWDWSHWVWVDDHWEGIAEIHFNVIAGNTHGIYPHCDEDGPEINAQNNWWGSIIGPKHPGLSGGDPGYGDDLHGTYWELVNYDPWIVLRISADPECPDCVPADGTSSSTITADMTYNSDDAWLDPTAGDGDQHIPDGTAIIFTSTVPGSHPAEDFGFFGSSGSASSTIPTLDGVAVDYLFSNTAGHATVKATAPNYTGAIADEPPIGVGHGYDTAKTCVCFESAITTWNITFLQSGLVNPGKPLGTTLVLSYGVNGTPFTMTLNQLEGITPQFTVNDGDTLAWLYLTPIASADSSGHRFSWTGDTTGGFTSGSDVHGDLTITGNYIDQYQVTFDQSGLDSDATGNLVVTAGVVSVNYENLPYTTAWMDSGTSLSYSYEDPVASSVTGKRFDFISDNGPGTPFNVISPITITGDYNTQFRLTMFTNYELEGATTNPSVVGEHWYDAGDKVKIRAYPPTILDPGEWYTWNGWTGSDGDGASSYTGPDNKHNIYMNSPVTETASWTQHTDQTGPRLYKDLDGLLGNYGWYRSDVDASLWATDWSLLHPTSGVNYIAYKVGNGDIFMVPIETEQPGDNQGPAAYPTPDSGFEWIEYLLKYASGIPPDESGPHIPFLGIVPPLDETVEILITQEGKTTLYHEAFDVAGNDSEDGSDCWDPWNEYRVGDYQVIKIDKTEPTLYKIEIGDKGSYGWYSSAVKVKLIATDPNSGSWWNPVESSGVDYITYQIDGNGWVTCDAPMGGWFRDDDQGPQLWICPVGLLDTFTVDGEGRHILYHEAYDVAGNDSNDGPGFSFDLKGFHFERAGDQQEILIDTTDPVLVKYLNGVLAKDAPEWFNKDVLVVLTATDYNEYIDTSGVRYIKYDIVGDGNSSTTVWVTIVGDQGDTSEGGFSTSFVLSDEGIIYLKHQAGDVAGNTDPEGSFCRLEPQQIKIDKTPPDLTKDLSLTKLNEVTVTLTGSDTLSGVDFIQYSTDGGQTWQTVQCTGGPNGTTTFTLTGIGDHELGHLVFDVAGNQYVLPDQIVSIVGGGTTGMPTTPLVITVDVMGTVASYEVSPDGTLLEDALITSPDGKVRLFILAGTRLLNADGTTPTYLNDDPDIVIKLAGTPPTPPGYQMVAAYECLPSGITFSKDANLIIEYDPDKLPADSTPIIAYYNETAGEWEPLETAGYVAGGIEQPNTVTSHIAHLSYYAVFAKIATAK